MRKAVRAIIVRDGQMLVMHRNKFGHEYYTLLGGGIKGGETAEDALVREIAEESGFRVTGGRLVFIEEAGNPYGTQYIYLCEAEGTTPQLHPDAPETSIFALGNKHIPMWLPITELGNLEFRTAILQKALMYGFEHGFPDRPVVLDGLYLDNVQAQIAKKGNLKHGSKEG